MMKNAKPRLQIDVHRQCLQLVAVDGALNAVESGSVLYARPVIGRGYSAETAAPLFCQLVKRSVSGKRISGAFGGDQLHATEHGESQCDFICLQTGSYSA